VLSGCPERDTEFDFDGDGIIDSVDCAPENGDIYQGAEDFFGDGVDSNCDGADGYDADGDSYSSNETLQDEAYYDCNDANPAVHPGADDTVGDGVDNNCDGIDGVDLDRDTQASEASGGTDCDDADPTPYRGADELMDCLDNDCDGTADDGQPTADNDGDGFCAGGEIVGTVQCCDGSLLGDCDDTDWTLHPDDEDGDAYSPCDGDCADADAERFPGAAEI